ncbi:hypothetical protein KP509_20G044100 [Ceratopteris richardii]|uniref:BHLH domain-containing protein n=1 Tax=Ceratopteris richardii TaxID=49495 RepID=A0A8T2SES7_CERRI|nr:hypothetical protein KP509_20G044100 [Ceratopteris richardii]
MWSSNGSHLNGIFFPKSTERSHSEAESGDLAAENFCFHVLERTDDQETVVYPTSFTTVGEFDLLDVSLLKSTPPDLSTTLKAWTMHLNETTIDWNTTSMICSSPEHVKVTGIHTTNDFLHAGGMATPAEDSSDERKGYRPYCLFDHTSADSLPFQEIKEIDGTASRQTQQIFNEQRLPFVRRRYLSSINNATEGDVHGAEGSNRRSKNLISERKRRMKLNESLYGLRAIVPNITKMDKASIVGDAINYVKDLQMQVKTMQEDILALRCSKKGSLKTLSPCAAERDQDNKMQKKQAQNTIVHSVLQINVSNMEANTHQLRILCNNAPGILVRLSRALESLDSKIVNADLTAIGDHFMNVITIKTSRDGTKRPEDVGDLLAKRFSEFGLEV